MRLPRVVSILFTVLVIALFAAPALAKTEHLRGCLVRGVPAVDADAKGKIDLETKTKKGDTEVKLRIQAQKLTGFSTVDFVLFDEGEEDDGYTYLRAGVAVEDGSAVLTLKTKDGDSIDGDDAKAETADDATFASIAGDLGGRLVGVLVGGTEDDVILVGFVPVATTKGPKKDKAKSRDFGNDQKAKVSIEWKAKKDRIRLYLKTKHAVLAGAEVTFLLVLDDEEEDDDDTFVLGKATANDEGQVKLKLRTDHGDPLPLDFLNDHAALGLLTVKIFIDEDEGDGEGNGEIDDGETVVEGTLPGF